MFFAACLGGAQKSPSGWQRGKLPKIPTRRRKDAENRAAQIFALWQCGKWFNLSGYQDKLCCNCHLSPSLSSQWNVASQFKPNLSHQSCSDCGLQEAEDRLHNNWFLIHAFSFPLMQRKKTPHSTRENVSYGIQHLHYLYSFISQCFTASIVCVSLFLQNWEILHIQSTTLIPTATNYH